MAHQLLLCLILTFLWSLQTAENNVFLRSKVANRFLQRTKRANSFLEELKPGNIERECYEERCSKEEAREAFEDQEKTENFWNIYVDGDQCLSNPCHYGGTCKDGISSYSCTCLAGYQGQTCEYLIHKSCRLDNGDCWHFCRLDQNDIQCSCAEGYILGDDGQSCVAGGDFSCGRIKTSRNKRETSSLDYQIDDPDAYDVINQDNFLETPTDFSSLVPPLPSQNETLLSQGDDSDRNVRVVNGTDCKLGECPWQGIAPGCGHRSQDGGCNHTIKVPSIIYVYHIYDAYKNQTFDCTANLTSLTITCGHPWMALLINEEGDGFCGGTILSPMYVLTAAHCINQTKKVRVAIGEVDISRKNAGRLFTADKIYVHQKFVPETYDYDIALIQMKNPIQFSENVIPACLPTADFANQVLMKQDVGIVSGFGRTQERGRTSNTLKVVKLPYVDRHICKLSSNFPITENMFCAGYSTLAQDACQGDSGGPHITAYRDTYFVTGIISWGEGCARQGKYGVYTRVSKFIPWIKRMMRQRPQRTESSIANP